MTVWDVAGLHDVSPSPDRVTGNAGSQAEPAHLGDVALQLIGSGPADCEALLREAAARGETLDLRGADLRRIDLRPGSPVRSRKGTDAGLSPAPVVLDGVNLAGAMLSGACLYGVSLRGARLDGALLVGCDLGGADLTGASLRAANLTGASLANADLTYSDLRGASLLTADLSDATVVGADLRDALLQSAVLDGARLQSADLRWARLTGASCVGADIRDARFEGAALAMTDFREVTLSPSTDFGMAFLYRARFKRTSLSREHVRGVIGEEITNYALARDTYDELAEVFEDMGRASDARWARRRASRMDAATHRPDRASRYHVVPRACTQTRMSAFYVRHAACWLAGPLRELHACVRGHVRALRKRAWIARSRRDRPPRS